MLKGYIVFVKLGGRGFVKCTHPVQKGRGATFSWVDKLMIVEKIVAHHYRGVYSSTGLKKFPPPFENLPKQIFTIAKKKKLAWGREFFFLIEKNILSRRHRLRVEDKCWVEDIGGAERRHKFSKDVSWVDDQRWIEDIGWVEDISWAEDIGWGLKTNAE